MKRSLSQRFKNSSGIIHIILLMLGCLSYAPRFLMQGIPHYINEDTYFHLNRMIGLRNVFRSPINYLNFAHNGPMVNIFYPWLTMYPMYLLYRITGSYVMAYKLFYTGLAILTIFTAYYVMEKISGNKMSAFVFAVTYTYSAYRFINVFRRAHLGESISITGLLLVLLGLYNIAFGDRRKWGSLAIGMAVIAYSHNLFLVTTSGIIGLFVLISLWTWDDRRKRLISLAGAALTALAFSAASIIPILQYLRTDQLYTPGGSGQGLQNTAFSLWMVIRQSLLNRPVSYAPGFLVLAGLLFLGLFYLMGSLKKGPADRNRGIDFFALTGSIVFFAATNLLPWKFLGDHTPLYIIQFVWRLNAHSTIFILAAFSYYLPRVLRSRKSGIAVSAVLVLLSVFLHLSAILTLHKEENTRILEAESASGDAITFDYAAKQAKEYRNLHGYAMDDILADGAPVMAEVTYSADGTVYSASLDLPSADRETMLVDIPVFRYSSQIYTLNGEAAAATMSDRGGVLMEIPAGERAEITVSCPHTGLTIFAWLFSLCVGLVFTGCYFIKPRFFKDGNKARSTT